MNYYKIILALVLASFSSVFAVPISVTEVNSYRRAAGLPILHLSEALTLTADAHARYLVQHMPIDRRSSVSAHEENSSLSGYTGTLAPQRAMFFDYPHSQVLENVSLGNSTIADSVGDLMSAIYHRFSFLDFEVDEIGAAASDLRYVYNLGKRDLSYICENQPASSTAQPIVSCLGTPMAKSAFDSLCAALPEEARFSQPYQNRCANGELLKADFMEEMCKSPPQDAILNKAGAYLDACGDGTRISAEWFSEMCASGRDDIVFQYSGDVYQICSPPVEVHAEWYQNFCATIDDGSKVHDSGRYYDICSNGFKIKSEYFKAQTSIRLSSKPEAVIWPSNGSVGIKPVFYDEDPHPTPDLPMTGYPISIQFNQQKVNTVSISGFLLEKFLEEPDGTNTPGWYPVSGVRMISQQSDVNQHFTSHQFAWFPLQRLEWGVHYRYRIDALADGMYMQYGAEFQVADFDIPVYKVPADVTQITATEQNFILYRQPDGFDAFPFRDINIKYNSRMIVRANVIDSNTVEFKVDGEAGCAPLYVYTRRDEKIQINRCANQGWRSLF